MAAPLLTGLRAGSIITKYWRPKGRGKRAANTVLERISLDKNLVEWRPERKTSTRRHQNDRQTQDKLRDLTARFRNALKKSVEGIIEAGRVLIEA